MEVCGLNQNVGDRFYSKRSSTWLVLIGSCVEGVVVKDTSLPNGSTLVNYVILDLIYGCEFSQGFGLGFISYSLNEIQLGGVDLEGSSMEQNMNESNGKKLAFSDKR